MFINTDHLYHGAALTQIAEHDQFTAINAFRVEGTKSRSAFTVNDDKIGVFLKYAVNPNRSRHREYVFTFTKKNFAELKSLKGEIESVFLALVCGKAKQICCLHYKQFMELIDVRREAMDGESQAGYQVLATLRDGCGFRVYVNAPETRNYMQGDAIIVPRNRFPNVIFS